MSLPDRNNPYDFEKFLQWRDSQDYWADDPFLQRALKHYAGDGFEPAARAAESLGPKVSGPWRRTAEEIARPEKRPYMLHYDGHKNRIDRIVRPHELETLEKDVFALGFFSDKTPSWVKLIMMFLVYENAEAGLACPIVCTEGLVEVLSRFADHPETKAALAHCKEGVDGEFGIGAQYLTEIQGGSDVPSNRVEAAPDGDAWRLYGNKFFCSATHADYAVVTAKPTGSEKAALFMMPSWLPGDKARERRNGYTIDRLKWKMGTCELPTAEITLDGAKAWQLGPLDRGLANVVGLVLTLSRLTVGLSGAASMVRAAREARGYARFREAFGLTVGSFPMVAGQLRQMEHVAQRTTAGAFKLYADFLALKDGLQGGLSREGDGAEVQKRFDVRELIMLQKITAAFDCPDIVRAAISIFGGHGVMEDFSALPRLYRDAAVNELWEGPRNVLLTQIHRDLNRAAPWYPPEAFVASILAGAEPESVDALGREAAELVGLDLLAMTEEAVEACGRWDDFCHRLFHAYQDQALAVLD